MAASAGTAEPSPLAGLPHPSTHQGFVLLAEVAVLDAPGIAACPWWSLGIRHAQGDDQSRGLPTRLSLRVGLEVTSGIGHGERLLEHGG
jgi:hypothetical protein